MCVPDYIYVCTSP